MGSISSVPNSLSCVAAALGRASSGSSAGTANQQEFQSILESASPADAVALSSAALQLQQVDGILGLPSPTDQDYTTPGPDQLAAVAAQSQTAAEAANPYCAAVANAGKLNVLA